MPISSNEATCSSSIEYGISMCRSFAELCSRLEVLGQPEDGRALRGLVAANAFEHAGAVVQAVGADVDRGVSPVDELAVHPDLLGLAHSLSPIRGLACGKSYSTLGAGLDRVHRLGPREADELGRRERPRDGCGEPAPIHTAS